MSAKKLVDERVQTKTESVGMFHYLALAIEDMNFYFISPHQLTNKKNDISYAHFFSVQF